jgi:hypothetical protein
MKNSKLITRGIALAVSVFILFACCGNAVFGQTPETPGPSCFSVYHIGLVNPFLLPCYYSNQLLKCANDQDGGLDNGDDCSNCFLVTLESCDNAEYPASFQISSDICFSICAPWGDFCIDESVASVCDPSTKQFVWKNSCTPPCNGMTSSDLGSIQICTPYTPSGTTPAPHAFHISLLAHCGPLCQGQSSCTSDLIIDY